MSRRLPEMALTVLKWIIPAALIVGFLAWQVTILNSLLLLILGGWPFVLLVAATAALVVWGFIRSDGGESTLGPVLGVAGGVVTMVVLGVLGSYWQGQAFLDAYVSTQAAADAPVFAERAALNVARNQAQGRITTNGTLAQSAYLPLADPDLPEGGDRFTSLVEQSSNIFGGYSEVVNQRTALTGQTTTDNCTFDQTNAGRRLGGLWWANLDREIVRAAGPGIDFNAADAYGYCADGTPMVVQPLIHQHGGWPRIGVPAGVALYNGRTGALEVRTDTSGIPGPVLAGSLARQMRESTAAMGSWWEYMTGIAGYTDTSADENDPNGENRAEFVLREQDHADALFVTPLTKLGGSTAIAALSVAYPSGPLGASMTVYEFGAGQVREANSTVADRIKADFGDLAWASGLQVFEITPVSTDEWVASIGLRQNVTHRVRIAPDGSACLETAEGRAIRCSGDGDHQPSDPSTPVTDLGQLTDAQLADLADKVQAEISRRLRDR